MDRCYAVLNVKSVDTERRSFRGWATTVAVDRSPGRLLSNRRGVRVAAGCPAYCFTTTQSCRSAEPRFGKPMEAGIRFDAEIPQVEGPGVMHDRVSEAWDSVRAGIIRAVSIGFRALEDGVERLASGGLRFKAIEILELSLVAVPANQDCTIDVIKRYAGGQITKAPLVAQTATPTEVREALDAMEPLAERFRRGLDSPYSAEKLAAAISRGEAPIASLQTRSPCCALARSRNSLLALPRWRPAWSPARNSWASGNGNSDIRPGHWPRFKEALWHANLDTKGTEPGDGKVLDALFQGRRAFP